LNGSHHVTQSQAKIKHNLKDKITKLSDNLGRPQPFLPSAPAMQDKKERSVFLQRLRS